MLPPPSRDRAHNNSKIGNNANKLKPINSTKSKNDDEDFWKADFKGKNTSGYWLFLDRYNMGSCFLRIILNKLCI